MSVLIPLGVIVVLSILAAGSLLRNEFQSVKAIEKRHAYSIGYAVGRSGKPSQGWEEIYGDSSTHERKAYERGCKAGARRIAKV